MNLDDIAEACKTFVGLIGGLIALAFIMMLCGCSTPSKTQEAGLSSSVESIPQLRVVCVQKNRCTPSRTCCCDPCCCAPCCCE
jgi:hypothetical protein